MCARIVSWWGDESPLDVPGSQNGAPRLALSLLMYRRHGFYCDCSLQHVTYVGQESKLSHQCLCECAPRLLTLLTGDTMVV